MIRLLSVIAPSPTLLRFAREGAGLVFAHGNSYYAYAGVEVVSLPCAKRGGRVA